MKKLLCLVVAVMLLFSFVLVGCGTKAPTTTQEPAKTAEVTTAPEATTAPAAEATAKTLVLKDSPYFQGKGLPAVADRMPKEPKLTNEMPANELKYVNGTYGGTLRTVRVPGNWEPVVFIGCNEPLVNSPGYVGDTVTPNIVKSFEVSTDQKEFTFTLRDGMKWSDGQLLTTDDVAFAVNDVLFNKELTPTFPAWLSAAGIQGNTPLKLTVVDKLTFKISFDKPYGGFLLQLAIEGWRGYTDLIKPAHFDKKYHKTYADPAALEKLILDNKFKTGEWVNLFNKMDCTNWENVNPEAIGFPQLTPWILTKTGDIEIFERNPYYFKIDSDGNQLPYIDTIQSTTVQDLEMVTMKIIAGEVDHSYEYATTMKLALYKENEAKAGIKILTNTTLHRTATDLFINQTYNDPTWQKVSQDVRFRQALNLALDKKDIVDTVYNGYAKPGTINGGTFDLAAANKLLDDMGMKKGADGIRTAPDGKKFTVHFTYAPHMSDFQPMAQLVTEQWKLLGLDVQLKQIDTALWGTRTAANELEVTMIWTSGPIMWTWADWGCQFWSTNWFANYTSNGKTGIAPPADVLNFYKMIDSLRSSSFEAAKTVATNLRADMAKNMWYIVSTEDVIQPVVINAKLQNFDDAGFAIANNFGAEQWWFKK